MLSTQLPYSLIDIQEMLILCYILLSQQVCEGLKVLYNRIVTYLLFHYLQPDMSLYRLFISVL